MEDDHVTDRPTIQGVDLLIFDCDGVLIDSERIVLAINARELTAHGIPITEAVLAERFSGMPYADMYRALEGETSVRLPAGYAERAYQLAIDACVEETALAVPGVAAVLDKLRHPKCVASSSPPDWLAHTLEAANLWSRFTPHIFSAAEVARAKPAPDLFLHAASRMGVEPARCAVIEDSAAGVTAAVAAGMTPVGFVGAAFDPKTQAERLRAAGAVVIVDDMMEFPAVVGEPLHSARGGVRRRPGK
ncbi:HAD family hydrolase [Rhodoblastus sp.]|uniref:HAD family hydrolase n=1 Tax=Rhodoblastus sp. TaxID=1962975 RepID=UPI003F9A7B29